MHDDASTDKTPEIIKEYAEKYPDIIKPIYQTVNQYSQKISISATFQYPRAKGKYIAICEGDDYWTDEMKLQKQFDALEAHPEVDMCTHGALMINDRTGKIKQNISPKDFDTIIPMEEVILGGGGFVATNSHFFRKDILKNQPKFRKALAFDYTMQMYGAMRGGMLYLKDTMSVYRSLTSGSWTVRNVGKFKAIAEKIENALLILDEETNGKYHEVIEERILMDKLIVFREQGNYREIFKPEYKKLLKKEKFINKFKIYLHVYCPYIIKLIKRVKSFKG